MKQNNQTITKFIYLSKPKFIMLYNSDGTVLRICKRLKNMRMTKNLRSWFQALNHFVYACDIHLLASSFDLFQEIFFTWTFPKITNWRTFRIRMLFLSQIKKSNLEKMKTYLDSGQRVFWSFLHCSSYTAWLLAKIMRFKIVKHSVQLYFVLSS